MRRAWAPPPSPPPLPPQTAPPVRGYVNMTGVFFDTTVICTVTGLCICASGVLGTADASGAQVNGVALTALAFKTVLGPWGLLVSLGIVLFAFSTILGWEFCGETAFAFLFGRRAIPLYRIPLRPGGLSRRHQSLEVVWNLSDIFNALMAVPNLISLLLLSGTAARELEAFQPEIRRGRRLRQRRPSGGHSESAFFRCHRRGPPAPAGMSGTVCRSVSPFGWEMAEFVNFFWRSCFFPV